MKRKLSLIAILTTLSFLCGCQNSGLTIINNSTGPETKYVFVSSTPVLECENGEFYPDIVSKDELVFYGDFFKDCILEFKGGDFPLFSTKQVFNATTGTVLSIDSNFNLEKVSGNFSISQELTDTNSNNLADILEPEPQLEKLVIIVMEGDNLQSAYTLTPYLKKNFEKLHEGITDFQPEKTKFIVIWDGGKANGLDGNSDLVIVDPAKLDARRLDTEISNFLAQKYVSPEDAKAGIIYWNFSSDNLSNHLGELIEIATKAFPAKKYDLIISDHGDGWHSDPTPTTRTVFVESAQAPLKETWLGTKQFAQVLKRLKSKGIEFELIGFDECLMGELVTLSAIAPYAQVLVASPYYEPLIGWGDIVWYNLPKWYEETENSLEIGKKIVNGFVDYYKNNYYGSTIVTLTTLTSKAVLSLKEEFEKFAYGLYQTAQNEAASGRLFRAFFWDLVYGNDDTYFKTMWISPQVFQYFWEDSYMKELTTSIEKLSEEGAFLEGYGYIEADDENSLGADLLYLVAGTGATARAYQLGYSPYKFPTNYTIEGEPVTPFFAYYNVIEGALDFIRRYNFLKDSGKIYSSYLGIDAGYTYPVTGSGLAVIYPYTSPYINYQTPLCLYDYENFVSYYNTDFPNYSNFVQTVFEELQKGVY